MRVLAIDTSLPAVSVCLYDGDAQKVLASDSLPMERGHAEALMPMIQRLMERVAGGFASIGRVAVTVGPGSFTGIRIGVAAARGIALACGVDAVGVSTLAALATPLLFADSEDIVAAVIDARHGRVFLSAYGSGGRILTSPRLIALHDACRLLGAGQVVAIGSGASILHTEARRMGQDIVIVEADSWPDIAAVAKLGLAADPASAPARPVYLKAPDVTVSAKSPLPRAGT
jgi:tRNA threonylcarbamoyl adenosine modification protein YeaZ